MAGQWSDALFIVFCERSELLLHDRRGTRQSGASAVFPEEFEGVLITDFWGPYESMCAEDRQYCLPDSWNMAEEL